MYKESSSTGFTPLYLPLSPNSWLNTSTGFLVDAKYLGTTYAVIPSFTALFYNNLVNAVSSSVFFLMRDFSVTF